MTATSRRVAPLLLVVALAACVSSVSPAPTSPPSLPAVATPANRPGAASPTPDATVPATTETEFGRIWDGLPASFPRPTGASVVDQPSPASAAFVSVVGEPRDVSQAIGQALTAQGWQIDVGSPLEDGTIVMEATGQPAGCEAEIRFTKLGGSAIMTVLYGAACPFS